MCTLNGSTLPSDSTSMWLQNSKILNGLEEHTTISVPYLIKSSSRDRSRAFMGALVYFHSRIRFLRPILPLQVIGYAEVGQKTATGAPMGNAPGRGWGQLRPVFSQNKCQFPVGRRRATHCRGSAHYYAVTKNSLRQSRTVAHIDPSTATLRRGSCLAG